MMLCFLGQENNIIYGIILILTFGFSILVEFLLRVSVLAQCQSMPDRMKMI